ncbi:hypothetical protein BSR42_07570 [Megasphaera cerevisiae]|nr:hypothetical protein BSR42_07570 [Megasphaera cerevisiae]
MKHALSETTGHVCCLPYYPSKNQGNVPYISPSLKQRCLFCRRFALAAVQEYVSIAPVLAHECLRKASKTAAHKKKYLLKTDEKQRI